MKVHHIVFALFFAFASIVAISPAYAFVDEVDRATIPFDFYAAGQRLPAGTYTIELDLQPGKVLLRDESGRYAMFMIALPTGRATDKPELLFDHSGDSYVLQEWKSDVADVTFHSEMLGKTLAARVTPTQVEVALNR